MKLRRAAGLAAIALFVFGPRLQAWGVTGHRVIARVAVQTLPPDVPDFLLRQIDWIGTRSITPDNYRAASEPFIKMEEDPSHEWHLELVNSLPAVPRSREEFIQLLYDQYRRYQATDPTRATTMNVRSTGTLPYTLVEVYERLKVTFRDWRQVHDAKGDTQSSEMDAAFYVGWLSHYAADGAQPLHSSVHHDGWIGANPRNFTRDGALHWGFENDFVDLIALKEDDIRERIGQPHRIADVFTAAIDHLSKAHTRVETVYALDLQHAFADARNLQARELVYTCTADAATFLRDLIVTAWTTSAAPAAPRTGIVQPNDPANPRYNPATGSAPAAAP